MKKIALLSMLTLALLLTQCKKKEVDAVTNSAEKVFITFNATNVGEKTVFHPEDGTFTWNAGSTEYIHVGGNVTGYLGKLSKEAGSSDFSGDIDDPSSNERLYFIYLGNGDIDIAAGTTSITVDFSNQSATGTENDVTNYHIAVGSAPYSASGEYSANMVMKMAIAYFDLSNFSGEIVYMHGDDIYSKATISFNKNKVAGAKGYVNLGVGGSTKYVAMLPQQTPSRTFVEFGSDLKTGQLDFLRGIDAGKYYCNASDALSIETTDRPTAPLSHAFSVSSSQKVKFSPGNLRYNVGSGKWSFSTHQYDCLWAWADDGMQDLFCWGQNGNNETTMNSSSSYYTPDQNLTCGSGGSDWGSVVSLGDQSWRTMTFNEWNYLITERAKTNYSFVKAVVNGYYGLVLFPDDWKSSLYEITDQNNVSSNYEANAITRSDWETIFEANGAVFLPAAGRRNSSGVFYGDITNGFYWINSYKSNSIARCYYWSNTELSTKNMNRNEGYSVRLVCNVGE